MRNKVIGKGSYFLLTAAIATGILAYLRFNEQAASPDVTFLKFPLQEEVFIDLDIANSVFYQQSPREQRDQILDWLLYTVVANSGLSARELTYAFYDLPIIRQGFNKNFANFSYGLIRSKAVGANNLIAVIPRLNEQNIPLSRPERIDYLAHIADEYRKNTGRIAQTIFVFEYDINLAEAFALITRQDNIKGESLFSEQQGYFTAEIRNLQSLQTFLEKTDDITYAKMQDGVLVVGGRKIQSRQYRGINDELIATLFLSEKTLRTARETMDRLGQQEWKSYSEDILSDMLVKDRTLERIAELAEENPNLFRYSNPIMRNDIRDLLSPQLNEDRYQQIIEEWRETFTKKYEKEIKELKEGSGFSLDAEYDYEALIRLLSENRSLFLGIMLDEQEFTEVIADLNRKDPSKYLRYVDEPIRAIKYLVSAQDDQYQPKYRSIKNTNPQLLKLIEDLDNCRFQYARYDGDLEGTEVGMILFYTDLLMKLWSIDFVFSSPDSTLIPDFMTDVKMGEHHSSIYSAERR